MGDTTGRRQAHVKIYLERCQKLGIEPHFRVLSRTSTETSDGYISDITFGRDVTDLNVMYMSRLQQTNLDQVVRREPKQPPFTVPGLLDYIVELIVFEDEAFLLVERIPFADFYATADQHCQIRTSQSVRQCGMRLLGGLT